MTKERAKRNRTLTLTDEERRELQQMMITAQDFDAANAENTIVCADLLEVIDQIPDGIADLIIID